METVGQDVVGINNGAAWTQAVGSVGAILVAVWVFHRGSRHAEHQSNLRIAAGVRLKASIVETLVKIARVMLSGAYRTVINGKRVRTSPLESHIRKGLERALSDMSLTVSSLDQFSVADMACGPEAIMWSTARSEASRLIDLCGQIEGGEEDPRLRIEAAIARMLMVSSNLERLALRLEAGDWKGASSFTPSNPSQPPPEPH